jgi:LysR family transcriptional activator of nhaA
MDLQWLNYHHLLYFWTVAREGGLAPAGRRLKLSESALSGQIKRLEKSLGHPLFEKRGRKLALTETGRVAYQYAEEIFDLGSELLDAIRGRPAGRGSKLVVGVSDVIPKQLVRSLLTPALELDQRVALVCVEDRFERLLAALAAHELDVVIADAPVPPGFAIRAYNHVLGESTVSVLAPSSMASQLRRGFPAGLDGAAVVLPLASSSLRRNLDAWFASNDVRPDIRAEAEDTALLKAFAAEGMGAMFAPTAVSSMITKRYGLTVVAEIEDVRERFYAISAERRLAHPAVVAIQRTARRDVFG